MSFDLYLYFDPCSHCGRGDDDERWIGNATHNINPMVEAVFKGAGHESIVAIDGSYADRSWGRLHGRRGSDVREALGDMLAWFNANEDSLRAMDPPSGWGSTDCVRRILNALIEAIDAKPNARIRTSG